MIIQNRRALLQSPSGHSPTIWHVQCNKNCDAKILVDFHCTEFVLL